MLFGSLHQQNLTGAQFLFFSFGRRCRHLYCPWNGLGNLMSATADAREKILSVARRNRRRKTRRRRGSRIKRKRRGEVSRRGGGRRGRGREGRRAWRTKRESGGEISRAGGAEEEEK